MARRIVAPLPTVTVVLLVALAVLGGCTGGESVPGSEAPATAEQSSREDPEAPAVPSHLPFPFTPEQIRDEMSLGFTVVIKTTSPEGEERQRWTVVGWGDEGVEIEYAPIGEAGEVIAEPRVESSSWVELRDHATFDATLSTREETTLDTPLGALDGWLYRVPDEEAGTVSLYFFASKLPGAPIVLRVEHAGETVMTFEQLERHRPEVGE